MRSSTKIIIGALRILSRDIQSDDGVANAAIAEAADRMEKLQEIIRRNQKFAIKMHAEQKKEIERLKTACDKESKPTDTDQPTSEGRRLSSPNA